MTPQELSANIGRNAWDWGLVEFCHNTGLDSSTDYSRGKFEKFQQLAKLLGEFDDNCLIAICRDKIEELPPL